MVTLNLIFSPAPDNRSLSSAQKQTVVDSLKFTRELGFRQILFTNLAERPIHYVKLTASWKVATIFLALYPQYCRGCYSTTNSLRHLDTRLLDFLARWKRNSRSILFVDDLPIQQALALNEPYIDEESYEIEGKIFRLFDILCVYNEASGTAIREKYGISNDKFVEIELRDYGVSPSPLSTNKSQNHPPWRVMYVGSGERAYAGEWPLVLPHSDKVSYEFIGTDWEWLSKANRLDIVRKQSMRQQDLCDYLSEHADFGIVAYSDKVNEYSKYVCPSKFATYLSAGLPVIVSSQCEYVAALTTKYRIGLPMDSFDNLPARLEELPRDKYEEMRRRCAVLAEKIRSGYFFKRAVMEAIRKLT